MSTLVPQPQQQTEEPTLGALLLRIAREKTPYRFYQAIQLAFPWAVYFGMSGWYHAAAGATAVGFFGLWALADRWLQREDRTGWSRVAMRVVRASSATASAGLTFLLVLERYISMAIRAPIS